MTVRLIARDGALKGLILELEGQDQWIIGRDPEDSTLVVEDPKVSRKHLLCRQTESGIVLENLSSTNPTIINDQILEGSHLLQEGDRIKIGGTIFHFTLLEQLPSTPEVPLSQEYVEPSESFEQDTIYKEEDFEEPSGVHFDLTQGTRFVLKVIAGPNTGAEFALDEGKSLLIGTDAEACDIVFHDLSVSAEHAALHISAEGTLSIEDKQSRNGVVVDKKKIEGSIDLTPNEVVGLGTSAFLIIDREAPSETIVSSILEPPQEEPVVEEGAFVDEEGKVSIAKPESPQEKKKRRGATAGNFIFSVILCGIVILFGVGIISLFKGKEVVIEHIDYSEDLNAALSEFPAVKYTFNSSTGRIFLMGHVATGVDKSELMYYLRSMSFLTGIEDNVVNDEAVWQEMNILLSKNKNWTGVSMHSPQPGVFVLTGYLKTTADAVSLSDYLNVHFNYIDRLQDLIVVQDQLVEEVRSELNQDGFDAVVPKLSNGELSLTGHIRSSGSYQFQKLIERFKNIRGVRLVKSSVILVAPQQAVVDLNERYPGRYRVTGYSLHGGVSINVVINGKFYKRGSKIDGMTIIGIHPNTIFLEKDGLKYKIDYSK